jgi:hypothetical protein
MNDDPALVWDVLQLILAVAAIVSRWSAARQNAGELAG